MEPAQVVILLQASEVEALSEANLKQVEFSLTRPFSHNNVEVGTFRGWVKRKGPTFKFLCQEWSCVDIGGGVSGATLHVVDVF